MKKYYKIFYLACFLLLTGFIFQKQLFAEKTPPESTQIPNYGQDFTLRLTRFDVRYRYVRLSRKADQQVITFRLDKPFFLSEKWCLGTRMDMPLVVGNQAIGNNFSGKTQFTTGEILNEAYLAWLPNDRLGMGAGSQFIWPTAYRQLGGQGKFQALPFAGFRYFLPEISKGSYVLPAVRYETDYAGSRSRPHIRQLRFEPEFNISFPRDYFFTLYSSYEILYDIEAHAWFIPMNFMVGKEFRKTVIVSAEFFIPMFSTEGYSPYKFKVEARIGYFF